MTLLLRLHLNLSHLTKLGMRKLLADSLGRAVLGVGEEEEEVLGATPDLALLVGGALGEFLAPGTLDFCHFHCQVEGGRSEKRLAVLEHVVVHQRQLQEVPGEVVQDSVYFAHLDESLQEPEAGGVVDLKVQGVQHLHLLVKNLLFAVSVVRDVNEVFHNGSVDFFVFASYQHRCHSDQLQVLSGDFFFFEISVDQVDGQVQCLRDQLELVVHVHQPVHQDRAHFLVDVLLGLGHVVTSRLCFFFLSEAVLENILSEISNLLGIPTVHSIHNTKLTLVKMVESLFKALDSLVDGYLALSKLVLGDLGASKLGGALRPLERILNGCESLHNLVLDASCHVRALLFGQLGLSVLGKVAFSIVSSSCLGSVLSLLPNIHVLQHRLNG